MTFDIANKFSRRTNAIKESMILALNARAKAMQAAGKKLINLTVGEPDFETPDHIKQAAVAALAEGKTRYTPVEGVPELKAAIVEKFKRENDLIYKPDQVMASTGGKQVIFNALMATLNPGDEVVMPTPCWTSYFEIVKLFEAVPVSVPCPIGQGFKMSPAALEKAITPKTKWLMINSSNNPTGAVYTKEELQALAAVLLRHPHVMVMTDDMYEHLVYDGLSFFTLPQIEPKLYERTLIVNGVSKAYAMTGWRMGIGAGPAPLIKEMTKLQSQSTSNPCSVTQWATVAALNGPKDFLHLWRAKFTERRDAIVDALNKVPGLTCPKPQGAFYVYPSCANWLGQKTPEGKILQDDGDVAAYLLESAEVTVVPGVAFGQGPNFRISYATSLDLLQEAGRRITLAAGRLSR
ncbi:MAG: pyridoxal phosphate-dependent aminotransferase [Dongiaceae bacterium]